MDRVQGELGETGVNPPQMVYLAIGCSTLKVQPVPLAMGDGFGNCAPGSVFECVQSSLILIRDRVTLKQMQLWVY